MWRGKRVSVIFPTFNEKDSIRGAVVEFLATGLVDELIVVNNNAAPGTDEEVAGTAAKLVHEVRQGYGFAIRRGLLEAKGDLIILAEPDGTFNGGDVLKLLAYSDDFDIVLGTRTNKGFIWEGANMGVFLKWGNLFVAKLVEFLFASRCQLTDVGCTMRLMNRRAVDRLAGNYTVGGSYWGPEMMILTLLSGLSYTEIPVSYRPRVGVSAVTGSKRKAFGLGLQMITLVLRYRLRTLFAKPFATSPELVLPSGGPRKAASPDAEEDLLDVAPAAGKPEDR